ncbi:hypothetical protein PT286_04305 [Neisseriaceae bacterium ESL0693]|nr:hypothetical protein [Neisseriaceae bacterium ESL0693]
MKHKSIKKPSLFIRLAQPDNALVLATLFLPVLAFAASGGGFTQVTNTVVQVRGWIYALVGVLAGGYFVWNCFLGWQGNKPWSDILILGLWIAAAGAGIAIGEWVFKSGGSVSL